MLDASPEVSGPRHHRLLGFLKPCDVDVTWRVLSSSIASINYLHLFITNNNISKENRKTKTKKKKVKRPKRTSPFLEYLVKENVPFEMRIWNHKKESKDRKKRESWDSFSIHSLLWCSPFRVLDILLLLLLILILGLGSDFKHTLVQTYVAVRPT